MSTCVTCQPNDCAELDPLEIYSLQREVFPFVLSCPPGYDCSAADQLRVNCCDQEMAVVFPKGATPSERATLTQALLSQCALAMSFCGTLPNSPFIVYLSQPQSCTVECPSGQPFTYTVPAGTFGSLTARDNANTLAHNYACQNAASHIACLNFIGPRGPNQRVNLGSLPSTACIGTAYLGNIVATGDFLGDPPATNFWSLSGTLPPGLTFHGGDIQGGQATIDGTPTTAGTYAFSVTITAPGGATATNSYSIVVFGIDTASPLPDATVGTVYDATTPLVTLTTAGMTLPITWSVIAGSLPDGLSLDPTSGKITGTPTTPGLVAFTIQAVDSSP